MVYFLKFQICTRILYTDISCLFVHYLFSYIYFVSFIHFSSTVYSFIECIPICLWMVMIFTIHMATFGLCSGRFWQFEVRCPDNAFYDFNFAPRDGSPATSRLCQADKGWRRWPGQIAPNQGLPKTWRIRTFVIRQLLSAKWSGKMINHDFFGTIRSLVLGRINHCVLWVSCLQVPKRRR